MNNSIDKKARFKKRVRYWAEQLDSKVTIITVRSMKNKWASYSTTGRLTFDTALLNFSMDLRDYVIIHELLHYHVPNHGKLWKSLIRAHLGDYEMLEKRLEMKQLVEESDTVIV